MNIKGKPGSKERLLEMFQGVNKLKINENIINERRGEFPVGTRVKVSDGSGIDSNKTGVVVSPSEVKTDGRGVPTEITGVYSPVDWSKESAILLDDGGLITMFNNRLNVIGNKQTFSINENNEPVVDSTGERLSIGDVIRIDDEVFQIIISKSEGKPFVVPFDIKSNKVTDLNDRISFDQLRGENFEKIMSFSDTDGGFMFENLHENWGVEIDRLKKHVTDIKIIQTGPNSKAKIISFDDESKVMIDPTQTFKRVKSIKHDYKDSYSNYFEKLHTDGFKSYEDLWKMFDVVNEENVHPQPESDPFGGARQELQDGPGYGDEKPVNKKLRVNSVMFDKFIAESTDQDKYEDVIFMQGDEASEPLNILMNQGKDEALEYLKQWHEPGSHMGGSELGHGTSDQIYEKDGYIMSWNPYIGYIGLQYNLSDMDESKQINEEGYDNKEMIINKMVEIGLALANGHISQEEHNKLNKQYIEALKLNGYYEKQAAPEELNEINPKRGVGGAITPHERELLKQVAIDLKKTNMPPTRDNVNLALSRLVNMNEEDDEKIEGGLADGEDVIKYDPDQILKGIEIEMEHTKDPAVALEIAMDHLEEIPDYYDRLDDMEKEAEAEDEPVSSEEPPVIEDDVSANTLLGYNIETPNANQEVSRYEELDSKDFDLLSGEEREELFELWQRFGK